MVRIFMVLNDLILAYVQISVMVMLLWHQSDLIFMEYYEDTLQVCLYYRLFSLSYAAYSSKINYAVDVDMTFIRKV